MTHQTRQPPGIMVFAAWLYMIGLLLLSYSIFGLWPQRGNGDLRHRFIVTVLSAALFLLAGWTFVTLRDWGRQMVIIFLIVLSLASEGHISEDGQILFVVLIWYLLRPKVKAAFKSRPYAAEDSNYLRSGPHRTGTQL